MGDNNNPNSPGTKPGDVNNETGKPNQKPGPTPGQKQE